MSPSPPPDRGEVRAGAVPQCPAIKDYCRSCCPATQTAAPWSTHHTALKQLVEIIIMVLTAKVHDKQRAQSSSAGGLEDYTGKPLCAACGLKAADSAGVQVGEAANAHALKKRSIILTPMRSVILALRDRTYRRNTIDHARPMRSIILVLCDRSHWRNAIDHIGITRSIDRSC